MSQHIFLFLYLIQGHLVFKGYLEFVKWFHCTPKYVVLLKDYWNALLMSTFEDQSHVQITTNKIKIITTHIFNLKVKRKGSSRKHNG